MGEIAMRLGGWAPRSICLLLGLGVALPVAQAADQNWSFDGSLGLRHDNTIVVEETDVTAADGDSAAKLNLGLEFETELGSETSLEFGYSFGLLEYFQTDDFDRQSHNFTAGLQHDLGTIDIGATYGLYHARLDGEAFLTLHRVSPYLATRPSEQTYLRFGYAYSDYDLIGLTARDADAHQGTADFYYLLDGIEHYLRIGVEYERRDALDDQFSFDANALRGGFVTHLPVANLEVRFGAGYIYEQRDYQAVTPSIGVKREDTRHTLSGDVEVPLGEHWFSALEYRYRDSSSNLPVADYQEQRFEWLIGARF